MFLKCLGDVYRRYTNPFFKCPSPDQGSGSVVAGDRNSLDWSNHYDTQHKRVKDEDVT